MARPTNDHRHREVLDVAMALIRERGIHATSMGDIAAAAGMSKSTLLYYFPSRATLLERIQQRLSEIARDELDAVAGDTSASPLERLRALVHVHASHCVQRVSSPVLIAFMQQWGPPTSEHGRQQLAIRQRYERVFVDAVAACIADGSFAERDPRYPTLELIGATTWMAMWYQPGIDPPLVEVVDELLDVTIEGLRHR